MAKKYLFYVLAFAVAFPAAAMGYLEQEDSSLDGSDSSLDIYDYDLHSPPITPCQSRNGDYYFDDSDDDESEEGSEQDSPSGFSDFHSFAQGRMDLFAFWMSLTNDDLLATEECSDDDNASCGSSDLCYSSDDSDFYREQDDNELEDGCDTESECMPNQEDFGYVTDEDDGNDSLITQSFYKQEVKKKRARDIKKDRPYKAKYNVLRASAPEVKIGKKERREAYKQSRATTLSQSTMLSRHRAERFAQEKCGSRKTEKVRKALNRAEKRAYQETISAARKLCEDSEDESEDEIDSDKEELKRIAKQIMIFQPDAPEVISDKRLQDAQRKLRQAGKK